MFDSEANRAIQLTDSVLFDQQIPCANDKKRRISVASYLFSGVYLMFDSEANRAIQLTDSEASAAPHGALCG
jgi:hypothetical protein